MKGLTLPGFDTLETGLLSTLTVNIIVLGIGTHIVECTALFDSNPRYFSEDTINITIKEILQNIYLTPESLTFTMDSNEIVSLTCSMEGSPPPRIE